MRTVTPWITIVLVAMFILTVSCNPKPPDKEPGSTSGQTVQESNRTDENLSAGGQEGVSYPDPYKIAPAVAMEYLGKLGFDTSILMISSLDMSNIPGKDYNWDVLLADGDGDFAKVVINEALTQVTDLKLYAPYRNVPQDLAPGPDLVQHVAQKLGLDEQGYRFASWTFRPGMSEYRKYTPFEDKEIATTQLRIITSFQTGELMTISTIEQALLPNPQIKVDQSDAVDQAIEAIGDTGLQLAHAELLQIPPGTLGNMETAIVWEVYFKNGAHCLVNADGTGTFGYEVPTPQNNQ